MAKSPKSEKAGKAAKSTTSKTAAKGGGPVTKAGLVIHLSGATGLSKKDVLAVLDGLSSAAADNLKRAGAFVVPGIAKLKVVTKPAKPAHEGVNPFTKQPMTFAAKPASKAVKAKILRTFSTQVS